MRRLGLLAAGVLCGALAVSGQDGDRGDTLDREIDRLQALLRERIEQETPQPEKQVVLRMYDIAELCTEIREHVQPLEDLESSKYQPPEAELEPEPRPLLFEIDMLIEMIKMAVEPESWEMEGADIQPKNGRLFVRAIPRVHGKIERMLKWCRVCADRRVSVEVAVVRVAEGDAGLLSGALELSAEEAQRLSRDPLGAVTLAGFDSAVCGGRAGREISYVEDYDVKLADKAAIGDPIRGTVFAGATAEVQVCLDDGQGAILHCQLELSRVPEPIPVHPTEHGSIELPAKHLTRVQASFWAPLGRTVVAGACTVGEEPCAILVTVRRR
jgi:hypothetical protein